MKLVANHHLTATERKVAKLVWNQVGVTNKKYWGFKRVKLSINPHGSEPGVYTIRRQGQNGTNGWVLTSEAAKDAAERVRNAERAKEKEAFEKSLDILDEAGFFNVQPTVVKM